MLILNLTNIKLKLIYTDNYQNSILEPKHFPKLCSYTSNRILAFYLDIPQAHRCSKQAILKPLNMFYYDSICINMDITMKD